MAYAKIVEDVRAYFRANGISARVSAGWRERPGQLNQGDGTANRVVFTPSNPMQPIAPTHLGDGAGAPARQLFNLLFSYDVAIWGFDPSDGGTHELRHIARCIQLLELTAQAIHRVYHGAINWGPMRWTDATRFRQQGAELIAPITLNVPIYDAASRSVVPALPVPVKPELGE